MSRKKQKFIQGIFKLKNPQKYNGNPNNVIYRSSWELKAMMAFDNNPDIIKWSSEEQIVYYRSPVDNKLHRYFLDFEIIRKDKNGILKTYWVEIKPFIQTLPPKKSEKQTKTYVEQVKTFLINQRKWEAAREECKKKGFEFTILTEKELFNK